MKKWFTNLNLYYQTALISILAGLIIFTCLTPFYGCSRNDIPQGFILGVVVGLIPDLLFGLIENKEAKNNRNVGAIIIIISRFLLIGAVLVITALLYYKLSIKLFNPILTMVGYLFNTLVLTLLILFNKRK